MSDLLERSIEIILNNQHPSGAFPASPVFPNYQYCWFRDSAFIAFALDLAGKHESASRFHDWAAHTVNKRADIINRALEKTRDGIMPRSEDILHARYTLNSEDVEGVWPNFQLDGYGTWLWSVSEHLKITKKDPSPTWRQAMKLIAEYISALWRYPCYDCWEEFPDRIHPYTLGAIYAGLKAEASISGSEDAHEADLIKEVLFNQAIKDDHFIKHIGSDDVDASLLGLAVPYHLVEPENPVMRNTVRFIENTLRHGGGVHRYNSDTYYGGGEWILLTAWLGWYYAVIGERTKAKNLQEWISAQADSQGYLAEQVPATLNDEKYYPIWRKRWGEIAKPLLWSHANYIILTHAIEGKGA